MGNTNKKETVVDNIDTINSVNPTIDNECEDILATIWYGTKQKCPIIFHSNNIWDTEFETYCEMLINSVLELFNIILSNEISNIIIYSYLKTHILRRWYPRNYILNSLPKRNSLIPNNFTNSRKSQSIINDNNGKNNIIEYLIKYFDLDISLKHLNKLNINDKWETYFKNDDFLLNEILIYKTGDYFKKHIDTIYENTDKNNTIHKYDYTLIIIAPSNYKGGKLIIYNKNEKKNKIVIGNNNNLWQWILFPKIKQHECTKIISGIKIAFKFHISSYSFARVDGYDPRYNVAYEPMANDFIPKPQRHKNPFINTQLYSDSD